MTVQAGAPALSLLNAFPGVPIGFPADQARRITALHSPLVRRIRNFVLGPGLKSNIPQACIQWAKRHGLFEKCEFVPLDTPELCRQAAFACQECGVVALFWTCAVFTGEAKMFFGSAVPSMMFFIDHTMQLDEMQLAACDGYDLQAILDAGKPVRLASHPSPSYLLHPLLAAYPQCTWIEANSNGAAAQMCVAGACDVCITTGSAAQAHSLRTLHVFGSPEMVFFGGLPASHVELVALAHQDALSQPAA